MKTFINTIVYSAIYAFGFYLLELETVKEKLIFIGLVVFSIIYTMFNMEKN